MKKIFLLPFLFLIVACSLTHHTVTIGVLTLPARPRVNKRIRIRYNVDSIVLANKKNLQITLYYVVKGKIYAVPVALSHARKRVKASFILPDSAQAFALRPQAQYVLVSKKNGYISAIYDHAGKPVAGALAGMSLFYNAIGDDNIGSSLLDRPVEEDTALKMMQADFAAHPEIKHRWMGTYLNTLLTARKQAAYPEIENALQQMLSPDDVQPGDYATAYNLFLRMDRWNKADSVMMVGALKFPTGLMAKLAAESRFSFLQESMDSMLVHYQNFNQMFPVTDTLSASAEIQGRMLGKISFYYGEQEDYQKFMAFISLIKNPVLKARAYHYRAGKLTEAGKNPSFADSISKMSLDLIKQSMRHPEQGKQTYQTSEDREKEMQQLYARYADAYASLLKKKGR